MPRYAAEFGKLARGIWINLPQKTEVPNNWLQGLPTPHFLPPDGFQ